MDWLLDRFQSFGTKTACIEAGKEWTYADFLAAVEAAQSVLISRNTKYSNSESSQVTLAPDPLRLQSHQKESDGTCLPKPARRGKPLPLRKQNFDSTPGRERIVPIQTASTVEGLAQVLAIADSAHIALPLPPEVSAAERANMLKVAASSPIYDQLPGSGLILFSSGTSGQPKGMLHDLPALLNRFEPVGPREDRTLQLLLIDHIGGLDAAFRCLCAGSTLVIPEARTPEAAGRAIETHRINILPASPTFLNLMLMNGVHEQYDCSSVEIIAYGAEAMPEPLLKRLESTFPRADLQQKFGTSETGAVRIQSQSKDSLYFRIIDSDTEWKTLNGELWLKTPSRIIGYLNADNNALESGGWYRTGDLVEEVGDSLRIIGRQSECINVGGQKVHPSEVESVLLQIEGIDACRVFGEADPITGQHVACEIVSRIDRSTRAWKRAIRQHARGRLPAWKLPTRVTVASELKISERLKRG